MRRARHALGVITLLAAGLADPQVASAANELCGQTITSSTTLTADQACTGDGLILVGDGLTIDLGGHTLSGDGDAGDVGIDVSGTPHVTIRNGEVHGFGVGVGSQGGITELAKLSNVTLRANTTYGAAPAAKTVVIDKCSFLENDAGLRSDSQTLKVTSSAFIGNTKNGMNVVAIVSTFKNVVAVGNGFSGLNLSGSGGKTTVQSSLFARNGLDGVFIHDEFLAPPGKINVTKSTMVGNGANGVGMNGGFDAQHLVTVTVSGNLIAGNGTNGVLVVNDSDRTVISGNRIIGNANEGIDIDDTSDDMIVKGNAIVGNARNGISTDNPTVTISGNVLNANHDAAITAPDGAFDGGGNRARANGQQVSPCSEAITCPRAFVPKSGPVTPICGLHVSTSITLGADLSCSGANGLVVDADDITINLNGHQLDGGASPNTLGISINDHSGVTITNGVVQRFQAGISGGNGDNLKLVNVEIRENLLGAVYAGDHLTVSKTSAVGNVMFGLEVLGTVGAAAKVTDSFFVANGHEGFGSRAESTRLKNVVAAVNDEAGLQLGPGGGGRVQNGIVAANGEDGVQFISGFGVQMPWAVQKTLIVGNGMDGVVVETNTTGLLFDGNVIGANALHGIALMSTPDQTTIKKNTLVGNVSDGAFVDTAVHTTTLTQNRALGNGGSGLNVDVATATLAKNLAVANLLDGIRTPFGAIDGGGNQAHDNVAPVQCTPPIVCP